MQIVILGSQHSKKKKQRSRVSGLFLARFGSGLGSGLRVALGWVYARARTLIPLGSAF